MEWIDIEQQPPPTDEKIIAIGESCYDGTENEVEVGYARRDYTDSYWYLSNMGEGLRRLKLWSPINMPDSPRKDQKTNEQKD